MITDDLSMIVARLGGNPFDVLCVRSSNDGSIQTCQCRVGIDEVWLVLAHVGVKKSIYVLRSRPPYDVVWKFRLHQISIYTIDEYEDFNDIVQLIKGNTALINARALT